MGAADAVPGISGGTIALITGIYERLIRAITSLDPSVIMYLPALHQQDSRRAFWGELSKMDIPFLLSLGLGVVTSLVVLARVMEATLEEFPALTFAFFVGLIGASAVVLFERDWAFMPERIVAGIVGFIIAFLVAGASADGAFPHDLPVIFVAGMVAVSGMVLPGISGSFILILLGQYDFMIESLNEFVDTIIGLATDRAVGPFLEASTVVVTFVGGALVGLFTVAFVVRRALDNYRGATLAFLVSLMVGALRYPLVKVATETETYSVTVLVGLGAAILAGAVLVLILDRYTDDLDYTEA